MEAIMITAVAGLVSGVACGFLVRKIKADIEELKKDKPSELFTLNDEQVERLRKSFNDNWNLSEQGKRALAEQEEIRHMIEKIRRLK
ncbi:hypothetical protein [Abiotrophia defectiva]|uniref:hypothetical protein n=1 Tax=Abiotrophia defectiva TaxID=46125 RepID=UPI0028E2F3D0|nr:hypothetical protein [Abiotrophia defectiva]